jgi:hypothetical protein
MRRVVTTVMLVAATAAPLLAQERRGGAAASAAQVQRAVQGITEAEYRARIGVIADDSMRGRGTPSPELEKTAQWIAGQFQSFGLRPGGDDGGWLMRYRIRRSRMDTTSYVMAMGRGAHGHWVLGRDAAYLAGTLPDSNVSGPVVLSYGTAADTARPFGEVPLAGAIVMHVATLQRLNATLPLVQKAAAAGAKAFVVVADVPANFWVNMTRSARNASLELVGGMPSARAQVPIPVFLVRDSSALGVLQAAGETFADLRAPNAAGVRVLQGFTGAASARRTVLDEATAPNVIGVLEGSDPVLRNEYVFFTGHMDHVGVAGMGNGCAAVGADSICNGADDDASGTTGVVMLARAFAQLNPRPKRTLVFMTVSGEERGLWGSEYYSEHPVFPLSQTVADLNMDMIGRYYNNQPGWRDTITVIGKEHSSLGAVANAVTAAHPELHMQLIDDIWPTERFYFRSDHFNFARKGVPILFFFNGTHPDYHRPSDSVDKIDAEKASRIVQMVFYIGLDVANTTARPEWNPESRRQIVQPATP